MTGNIITTVTLNTIIDLFVSSNSDLSAQSLSSVVIKKVTFWRHRLCSHVKNTFGFEFQSKKCPFPNL
jgi:hypothetical protein